MGNPVVLAPFVRKKFIAWFHYVKPKKNLKVELIKIESRKVVSRDWGVRE